MTRLEIEHVPRQRLRQFVALYQSFREQEHLTHDQAIDMIVKLKKFGNPPAAAPTAGRPSVREPGEFFRGDKDERSARAAPVVVARTGLEPSDELLAAVRRRIIEEGPHPEKTHGGAELYNVTRRQHEIACEECWARGIEADTWMGPSYAKEKGRAPVRR